MYTPELHLLYVSILAIAFCTQGKFRIRNALTICRVAHILGETVSLIEEMMYVVIVTFQSVHYGDVDLGSVQSRGLLLSHPLFLPYTP